MKNMKLTYYVFIHIMYPFFKELTHEWKSFRLEAYSFYSCSSFTYKKRTYELSCLLHF